MTVRQFLKSIGGGVTALSVMACAGADEPLVTNVGRFEIPFDVDAAPGESVEGYAVLFGSQDGGVTWEKLQTVPASQSGFQFAAPRDGRYAFAVRRMDAQGNLQEAINNATPELEIVVDTTAPELKLELFEAAPGQVMLKWQSADTNLNVQTLKLEFSEGNDGRWRPVRTSPNANGQIQLQTTPGSVVSVRGSITDFAGNVGQKTGQLVLNTNQAVSATPGGLTIPPTPQPNTATQTPNGPAQPFGPSPFAGNNAGSSFGGLAIPGASSSAVTPAIRSGQMEMPAQAVPTAPSVPVTQQTATTAATEQPGFPAQAASSSGDINPFGQHEAPNHDGAQLVNNRVFDIDYTVEDVGPSGVGAVDLFVTEDGGQQWFRYGSDADLKSPFQVDSMGEGTFGFAVRVRNGLGISDPPPQPGELPMIVVTVDQTPPVIEFPAPVLRPDGTGSVQLSWKISEANSVNHSVRLEYAGSPNGPWTPLFDWQKDTGNYTWTLRQGGPTSVYFRLMARDAAGNVASAQNAQPVIVDLKRPVARVLRVQAASATTPAPGF